MSQNQFGLIRFMTLRSDFYSQSRPSSRVLVNENIVSVVYSMPGGVLCLPV